MISNKRQSEVVIKLTNMWIHGVDSILDWRMKDRAAARIKKIILWGFNRGTSLKILCYLNSITSGIVKHKLAIIVIPQLWGDRLLP